MTERLYYTDSHLTSFDALVLDCQPGPDKTWQVTLDRTAFYPSSGGQPFDIGVLGGARVQDVIDDDEAGVVRHVVNAPLEPGQPVSGTIDWSRRLDHMQQHSGQHILSAAFDRLQGVATESFHLGAESSTIDLAREVSTKDVSAAIAESNRVIWEDRPLVIRFVSADEAARLPLRKDPARTGTVRLVEIHDFDLSACGGTHVMRTGAVGLVVAAGWERFRGGSRVEFLCGSRVQRRFDAWRDALGATMRLLSVAPEELAGGIERMQSENKALQRRLQTVLERLAGFEARNLVARGVRTGNRLVLVETMDGWDVAGLRSLAMAARSEPGVAAAFFNDASPALVAVASHPDSGVDASAVVKALTSAFGGKGGGRADLAQAGGLQGQMADLVAAARELLEKGVSS